MFERRANVIKNLETNEIQVFQSVNAAKRASRKLGRDKVIAPWTPRPKKVVNKDARR